jgi:hypothetical protein
MAGMQWRPIAVRVSLVTHCRHARSTDILEVGTRCSGKDEVRVLA